MKSPRALLALLAGWLAVPNAADAQVVPAPPSPASEVIELSPFEVAADKDNGYRASGTLAGTRLRQDLRDVAASVSVVTKDFMTDIGATNLAEIMVYTTGTEVNGLGGNMAGADISSTNTDFDQINRQPTSIVRIRGIGSGTSGSDQARDYFTTDIPTDSYNMDRVEVMRGPNAMLFGLGSPSGIVNSSLIKAKLNADATSVEFKFGRYGTYRASLDHNEMVLKDKLAFRFAIVGGTQKYMQEPAFDQNRRGYGTVTYKPFKDTTIKISGELARRDANKPQIRPPNDSISWWFRTGKPVYDPTTSRLSFLGTPPPTTSPIYPGALNASGVPTGGRNTTLIGQFNGGIMVVNEDPNVRNLGITGYKERGVIGYELGTNDRLHFNFLTTPNATNPLVGDGMASLGNAREYLRRYATNSTTATNNLTWNFWRTPQMTDSSVYDFYTQMLEGPNKWEDSRWKTLNATVEQRIGKNAGIEVGADWQYLDAVYTNPQGSVLSVDINSKLPDGMPNPNFGRPYGQAVGWAASEVREREGARATAYYDLDLRKNSKEWLGKLLGRHIITGNVSSAEYFIESFGGRPAYSGMDYYNSEQAANAGTTTVLSNAFSTDKRAIWTHNYLGPALNNSADGRNAGIQNTRVDTSFRDYATILTRYYQSPVINSQAPAAWQDKAFSQLQNTHWDNRNGTGQYTISRRRSESLSKAIILNSRLFADNLITTLGWRSDDFQAYDAGAPAADPITNIKLIDNVNYPLKQVLDTTIDTFNYGIVGHAPRFIREKLPLGMDISLTYNKSDNTSPTSPRFNSKNGGAIPAPTGSTEEIGGRFGLFNGKLELRVVKFETAASFATNSALRGPQNNIVRATENVYRNIAQGLSNRVYTEPTPRDPNLPPTPDAAASQKAWNDYFATQTGQDYLNAYLFTGVGTAQITHDDRVDTVVSTSDIVSSGYDFELIYNPTKNWRISANGTNAKAVRANTAVALNSMADEFEKLMAGPAGNLPNGSNSNQSIRDRYAGLIVDIRKERDLDGSASPEERQWRVNFINNYTFTEGKLKDVKIGGAIRWQDKIAIGYPVVNRPTGNVTFNPVNDVKNPYYGEGETNYDAWIGYSRRLKHVKWSVQLNVRNIGVDKALIPVSAQPDGSVAAYRIAEPMTWTLSNTFNF